MKSNHSISYIEHDVSQQPDQADALKKLTGKQTVPTLLLGRKSLSASPQIVMKLKIYFWQTILKFIWK